MKEIYKLLDEYYSKFGDAFPTMEYGFTQEGLKKVLKQCIDANKSIHELSPHKEKDVLY